MIRFQEIIFIKRNEYKRKLMMGASYRTDGTNKVYSKLDGNYNVAIVALISIHSLAFISASRIQFRLLFQEWTSITVKTVKMTEYFPSIKNVDKLLEDNLYMPKQ